MKDMEKQNLIRRYACQDENKSRIEEQTRLLDENIQRFEVSFAGILRANQLTPKAHLS
jgi:hypothetical protein